MAKSRIGRMAQVGGLAAAAATRQLGTKTANTVRSEEKAIEANRRQAMKTADQMVTVLGSMRGAAMKVGQTLSVIDMGFYDEELRDEFQAKLRKLQNMAPTVKFKDMKKVIEDDLGEKLGDAFATFDEEPIAAASIGQVYKATLHDGREVAVKVQYPGIKDTVRSDLKNLNLVLKGAERFMPGIASKDVAQEITDRITEELDYELEASNHRALAREYRGHPFIGVPPVVTELCRERVIVTELVHARRFTELLADPTVDRNRIGEILMRFYVNGPYRHRLLNGDPHPGNSLFLDDGRVAFLDFGFFKRQTAEEVDVQLSVLRAVHGDDADALYDISKKQGIISGGRELVGPLMDKYRAATGWFMADEETTITSSDVTAIVLEHADMKDGFGDIKLPADQVTTLRAFGLVLAILGQLESRNNWFRISREVIFGDEPQTELGVAEAAWLLDRHGVPA